MKLNRNNTAIHLLESDQIGKFGLGQPKEGSDAFGYQLYWQMQDAWKSMRSKVMLGKVRYISDTFVDAYESAKDRMTLDLRTDKVHQSGAYIFRIDDGSGYNTIFYSLDVDEDSPGTHHIKGSLMAFTNRKEFNLPTLFAAHFKCRDESQARYYLDPKGGGIYNTMDAFELLLDMLYLTLFLRYCEVETKEIPAGRKAFHVDQKYLNETKSPVEIINSTWFTTIIRTEGFGVKGHFRLQPYPSLGTKKLIYIAPFQKHGYTRKAKKLLHGMDDEADRRPKESGEDKGFRGDACPGEGAAGEIPHNGDGAENSIPKGLGGILPGGESGAAEGAAI